MKRLILLTIMVLSIMSCRSVENLVEQGKYDEAIMLATKKLAGKKDKKTEHVMALENAFAKVTDRDLDEIAYLKSQNFYGKWDRIHSLYLRVRTRQNKIRPFLPLVSEDGYLAEFNFLSLNGEIANAANGAAEEHHNMSIERLELGRRGDKLAARESLNYLDRIDKYFPRYKDSDLLKDEAYFLAKTRILVNLVNEAPVVLPEAFCDHVKTVSVWDLNSKWKEYHIVERPEITYDLYADLQILDLIISPSLETRDRWEETSKIEDGWKFKKNKRGKLVLDSLGNKIKVTKYKTVKADIMKITREKTAGIVGNLLFRDVHAGVVQATRPIEVIADFVDVTYDYNGDKRALPTDIKKALGVPLAFPTDFDLTMEVAESLKGLLKRELYETPEIY